MQILFYILFSVTPLILWPRTSELFEFNKMIFVYIMTVLISAVWLTRCIAAKKLIFRRTLLDIPLLIFLGSQILSTIFSIDHRTSFFGYYSRFNGGLLSVISYSLLYWAFVSNMNTRYTLYAIRYTSPSYHPARTAYQLRSRRPPNNASLCARIPGRSWSATVSWNVDFHVGLGNCRGGTLVCANESKGT